MEKDIETYLRERVRKLGGLAIKFEPAGWSGAPDRLILLPGGRVAFAETKDFGKKPRRKQLYRHEQLRALGFTVYVPDSRPTVDAMIEDLQRGRERDEV